MSQITEEKFLEILGKFQVQLFGYRIVVMKNRFILSFQVPEFGEGHLQEHLLRGLGVHIRIPLPELGKSLFHAAGLEREPQTRGELHIPRLLHHVLEPPEGSGQGQAGDTLRR